jgi:cytochrome c-type protein NapB
MIGKTKLRWLAVGTIALLAVAGGLFAWRPWQGDEPQLELTLTQKRILRRAFDGAPPVIPHPPLGASCVACHTPTGMEVPGIGIAPANPHLQTAGMGAHSRCQQCHVFATTDEVFVASDFRGLRPPLHGDRLYLHAPPVTPHRLFLREDCTACHSGVAARDEIRCTHSERTNCKQCHALCPSGAVQ